MAGVLNDMREERRALSADGVFVFSRLGATSRTGVAFSRIVFSGVLCFLDVRSLSLAEIFLPFSAVELAGDAERFAAVGLEVAGGLHR